MGGRDRPVYAFEPAPRAFDGLVRHIALNDCRPRVIPVQTAVPIGMAPPRCWWPVRGREPAGRTVRQSAEGAISVPMATIDSFCAECIQPAFIKVDVEGAELDVLRGARETIRRGGDGSRCSWKCTRVWTLSGEARADIELEPIARESLGAAHIRRSVVVEGMVVRLKAAVRILIANDGVSDVGGVQAYLDP